MTEIMERPYKYSIDIKQDSKRNWYVGDVKVKGDNLDELKIELSKALEIVKSKMEELG